MYGKDNKEIILTRASIRGLAYQFKIHLNNKYKEACNLLSKYSFVNVIDETLSESRQETIRMLDDHIDTCFFNHNENNFALYSTESIESLIKRIELFADQILNFASWDSQSCVELFGKTLIHVGNNIKENGICVNSKKKGLKAVKAGGMLLKAYDNSETTASKHYYNSLDKLNTSRGQVIDDVSTWGNNYKVHNYNQLKKNIDNARTVLYNEERNKKISAWNNITKLTGKDLLTQIPSIDRWAD
jgi:hypothetical protein